MKMESWVRYSVAVYVGLLLAGAVLQREDVTSDARARVQLSQQEQLQMMLYEAQLQQELGRRENGRQPRG